MKVSKKNLFFKIVKDKRFIKDSNHPHYTAINFISEVISTCWVYGLLPLMTVSVIFILFSQNWLSEEKVLFVLLVTWISYVALSLISILLLIIIEPFTYKKWRKLIIT
jgi:hypothetical protein